jgi:hypothetical protein
MVGGKHHDYGLDGKMINGPTRDKSADSFERTHENPPDRLFWQSEA